MGHIISAIVKAVIFASVGNPRLSDYIWPNNGAAAACSTI